MDRPTRTTPMLASVIAAAVLLLPLCGHAGEPDAACQVQAQSLLDTLRPVAEEVAGKPMWIDLQWDTTEQSDWTAAYLFAPTFLFLQLETDKIRISRSFCTYSPELQRVILAHELGHGIDRVPMSTFYGDTDDKTWPLWGARPPEISATARALQIFHRAGFDTAAFVDLLVPPGYGKHVESATQLQRERDNLTHHSREEKHE